MKQLDLFPDIPTSSSTTGNDPERQRIEHKFRPLLHDEFRFGPLVSYVGNKSVPILRLWELDQLAKSAFFHQKLHEWSLLEVAAKIDQVKGELLFWNLDELSISQSAWDKVIHRGVKPVTVFAHPDVLQTVSRSTSYYRMLAMVSLKSMNRVGFACERYETRDIFPGEEVALNIARLLNKIISTLIEADQEIDIREFDLWRGMAAGTQAQGSWQNAKDQQMEITIRGMIQQRLRDQEWISPDVPVDASSILLKDGRRVVFASEPDIALYDNLGRLAVAVEIKGGIDSAGVLERIGAAVKSLIRAKEINPTAITVLVLVGASLTTQASIDLKINQNVINYWFTAEQILQDEGKRKEFLDIFWCN